MVTTTPQPSLLPVPNPTKSYWQTPPHPLASHRTTASLPSSADYIIIGSGITGASIAHKLLASLSPTNSTSISNKDASSPSILMLEARTACSAATGRNGGHCRTGRYAVFAKDLARYGVEEALRLEALETTNVRNVAKLVQDLEIECDLVPVETVDVFVDLKQLEEVLESLRARKEVIEELEREASGEEGVEKLPRTEYTVWEAEEARKKLLFPEAKGAVAFPAYTLSPYKLVCALLKRSLKAGMNLQTNTVVTSIEPIASDSHDSETSMRWTVTTSRGKVQAKNVILATNAYTGALYPPLANFINPTRGQIAVIRPGSKIDASALRRSCGINDVVASPYFHCRAPGLSGEGDIVMGGGRTMAPGREQPVTDDSTIHPLVSAYLTTALAKYFGADTWGEDPADPVVQEWTGIMGYTRDTQPIIGEAPSKEGFWVCAGFHGHGMALAFESAEALVQMMMGKGEEVGKWLPKSYRIERITATSA